MNLLLKIAATATLFLRITLAGPMYQQVDAMVSNETLAQVAAAYKGGSPLAETPYTRSYFYIGGEYVDDGSGGHVFRDQMYVEQLAPISGATQKFPLVIIHGQGQTGTVRSTAVLCWLTLPHINRTELPQQARRWSWLGIAVYQPGLRIVHSRPAVPRPLSVAARQRRQLPFRIFGRVRPAALHRCRELQPLAPGIRAHSVARIWPHG